MIALGFTEDELDAAPAIEASEWYREFGAYDRYRFSVELRAADGGVIDSFSVSDVTSDGGWSTTDDTWEQIRHVFEGYGPGLRSIYIQDGGYDSEYWAGHYGVRFDDASVVLTHPMTP